VYQKHLKIYFSRPKLFSCFYDIVADCSVIFAFEYLKFLNSNFKISIENEMKLNTVKYTNQYCMNGEPSFIKFSSNFSFYSYLA